MRYALLLAFSLVLGGAVEAEDALLETKRVFFLSDGKVRVMHGVAKCLRSGETVAQFYDRQAAKDPALAGVPSEDVPAQELPASREKRYAWRWKNENGKRKVKVDPDVVPESAGK